jgi:hypothetical protein
VTGGGAHELVHGNWGPGACNQVALQVVCLRSISYGHVGLHCTKDTLIAFVHTWIREIPQFNVCPAISASNILDNKEDRHY